jgi:tetratricopeptide (TPR) repeat protein
MLQPTYSEVMAQLRIPNIRLRSWRDSAHMTRAEFADAINRSPTGLALKLCCDEERIRRWEAGEVLWPSSEYRKALREVTELDLQDLGFLPSYARDRRALVAVKPVSVDPLATEREIFSTMELARLLDGADIGAGTLDALEEAADLLCRAYPKTPSHILSARIKIRLKHVIDLLGGRMTIGQHRRLLAVAGWMIALLGCVHYDMQDREEAEAARQMARQLAKEADDPDLLAWTWEMSAWFALVEDRYEDVIDSAAAGLAIKDSGSVGVQLRLQEAKAYARLYDARETHRALKEASSTLCKLPPPEHPDNHFVFDHSKWMHYTATVYTWLGDDRQAKEHALEVIDDHRRPDGTTRAPMRTAEARLSLATVSAREGDLDGAVTWGKSAFEFDTKPMADLLSRGKDLDHLLRSTFHQHPLAVEFHEFLADLQTTRQ